MLYNTDNALNVDLAKIVKLKPGEKPVISEEKLEALLNNLTIDAIEAREARHNNRLRLII